MSTTTAPTAGLPADRSTHLVANVTAGLVLGLLEVAIALSLATLIFSGGWSVHLAAASAIALVGAAIVLGLTALTTTLPGMVGSIQDTTSAVLAVIAGSIATRLEPASDEGFMTLVLGMVVSALAVGTVFFGIGALRLGDLIRYVPHPVVGGFLAGTGLLVVIGSFGVLTAGSAAPWDITQLVEPAVLVMWFPGVALAAALVYAPRRTDHPLALPGILVTATIAFYIVVIVSGHSLADAEGRGWLLGPLPRAELWQPWALQAWGGADWSVLAGEVGNIATLVVVALMAMLLNATGAELMLGRDADLNRELMSAGGANAVAGFFGAVPGYHASSLSALVHRLGARGRMPAAVAAGVCIAAMFLAPVLLARLPRFLLGGLLLFLGVGFVIDWLVDAFTRLPRLEYGIVVVISLVIATAGFVQGVALGLVLSIILFVVSYSRTDVAKHRLSGANYRSNVDRPVSDAEALDIHGDHIYIIELQGFVFFGSAHRMVQSITRRLSDTSRLALWAALIEFRHVTGMDASAAMSLAKAHRLAVEHDFVLVLTGVHEGMLQRLHLSGIVEGDSLRVFPDLDHGLQWCEERVLAEIGAEASRDVEMALLEEFPEIQKYLKRMEIPAGHTLIQAGETSREIFFLHSGRLAAYLPHDGGMSRIRLMGPGTTVGEIGAYLAGPRTASVMAEEPCLVSRLELDDLERASPATAAAVHRAFASVMAKRLADNVRFVEALRR